MMFEKLTKKIISVLSASVMLAGNVMPLMMTAVNAADSPSHTINIFDIYIRSGAEYYSTYTPDDPAQTDESIKSINDVYVWQADNSNEGHKFVYSVRFSMSGVGNSDIEEAVGERFMEIKIPAHILKLKGEDKVGIADAKGICPDEIEMPVPNINQLETREVKVAKTDENGNAVLDENGDPVYEIKTEYASDHQFAYEYSDNGTPDDESDDYCVIFNLQPISAGVVYEFPVAYRMNKNTWEYQDMGDSDPCQAEVEVHSWDTETVEAITLEQETKKIPVYIDTGAELISSSKKASTGFLTKEQLISKTDYDDGSGENDYRYVIWAVASDISNVTQKYSIKLDDNGDFSLAGADSEGNEYSVGGEVIAVNIGSGYVDGQTASREGLNAAGKRTDYVITRYPYLVDGVSGNTMSDIYSAPRPGSYTADNTASVKLTPADGQDASTEQESDGLLSLELKEPVWAPPAEKYSAEKYGLYNNGKSKVDNKSKVSSYELARLLTDNEITGLKYQTIAAAHAYGKTIENLNQEITEMILPKEIGADGTAVIIAGARTYTFNKDESSYTLTIDGVSEEKSIPDSFITPLELLDMQKIAALDIADNYYGQKALDYVFEDKTFSLANSSDPSSVIDLDENDYRIESFSYVYTVNGSVYDDTEMEFTAGEANEDLSDNDEYNTLAFYVYSNGSSEPQLAGKYNIRTEEVSEVDPTLVKYISGSEVIFADGSDITGYQVKTSNKYFYVELQTQPSVTLKPSDSVKALVGPIMANGGLNSTSEKKAALKNTAVWTVDRDDISEPLLTNSISGTDYIADMTRTSDISKKALGEKNAYKGQDGKTYKSRNDTLSGQYELAWQTRIYETANGVEVGGKIQNNVPVPQQSGVFYDLLPAHSDIIEGSVNVYVDQTKDIDTETKPLSPSSFEVLDRIDDYNGSGKKLLVIKINAPCNVSYTVTYVTVHSHEDIADYGSFALNTAAYQTGNADIGDGYPDDGGNYAVSMSGYIKGLDQKNGDAKRFIYAEATEDILALFPNSSGIYKKVSTQSDPTYRKTGVVRSGETYTYNIRMQNDSSTKARDIAIIDSVENYRSVYDENTNTWTRYNYGLLETDRDWNGTIVSFDLKGIQDKIAEYAETHANTSVNDLKLILYRGSDIVDLQGDVYSDSDARKYLLNKILGNTEKAEETAGALTEEQIREYDTIAEQWTEVSDWKNPSGIAKPAEGASDEEIQAYETAVREYMSGVTAFMVYTGENFVLTHGDSMSFTVKMQAPSNFVNTGTVDVENGRFLSPAATYNNVYRSFRSLPDIADDDADEAQTAYYYTHYDYTQVQYLTVGTLKFLKTDLKTKKPVAGAEFSLSGISDYGTVYNEALTSDDNGYVTFKNLERGTYQLIESSSGPDHILDPTPRTVTVDPQGSVTIVTINGDEYVHSETDSETGALNYEIYNEPRYHGNFEFRKVDSLSGKGISNTVFTLSGYSIYSNEPEIKEAVSDENGVVSFGDLEKGTYTLTETITADGYLPPVKNVYTVTSSGDRDLIFRITGENAFNAGTEYQIRNIPTAKMTLIKIDSITNETLDGAKFTLTADSSLNAAIANLTAKVDGTGWDNSTGEWTQTIDNSNLSVSGQYFFKYLPEGTYTLTENRAPAGYAENSAEYTIKVVKSADGKKLLVELPDTDDMQYIRLENGDFTASDKENAQYYRLLNDETYEDGKTVVKSWIGGTLDEGKFPKLHLSTEKPEANAVKVTIGTAFKTLVQGKKGNFTGLVQETALPDGVTPDTIPNPNGWKDTSYAGEEGRFYAWWDSTDNKVHWWSDADIIYMPTSCEQLFDSCNNQGFTALDLSYFYVDKVTSMKKMFNGCTNLKTITFNDAEKNNFVNGQQVTKTAEMFQNCTSLTEIDLGDFTTSSALTDTNKMFNSCKAVTQIDISNLVTSGVTDMSSMFADAQELTTIKTDYKKFTAGSALTTVNSMFKNCKKLEGLDLRGFGKCDNLSDISNWFWHCEVLSYIDLSNFETAKLSNINGTFGYTCYNGGAMTKGCMVFAKGKWKCNPETLSGDGNTYTWDRFNLYGTVYKSSNGTTYQGISYPQNSSVHLDIQKEGVEIPVYDTNRLIIGYFMDAGSSYYQNWASEHYASAVHEEQQQEPMTTPTKPTVVDTVLGTFSRFTEVEEIATQAITSPTVVDTVLGTFSHFTEVEEIVTQEITSPTEEQKQKVGKKNYTFEYVTAETGVPVEGEENAYYVDETVYLTVSQVVLEDGNYYTVSQKYKYTEPVKAKWTNVTGSAPAQWYCELMVNNADDEFFAWENKVSGYTSTAPESEPIKTEDRDDKPVITNAKIGEKIGSLELTKKLKDTDSEKFSEDAFWFRVTMKKADNTPYTMLPFDEDGVAYFSVRPNLADEDKIIINGIPAGCTYTVEEVNDPDEHAMPKGYTMSGESGTSGTITKDTTGEAVIVNAIDTTDLSLTKDIELLIKERGGSGFMPVTDTSDEEYAEWAAQEFTFTVVFENLVKGQEYSYTIDGEPQTIEENGVQYTDRITGSTRTAETVKTITIRPGQTVRFIDIPVGTKYTITEDTQLENSDDGLITYEVEHSVSGGNNLASESGNIFQGKELKSTPDEVVFTNIQKRDETVLPETVEVTINKEWYSETGEPVVWKKNSDGEYIKDSSGNFVTSPDGDYPSFLKVYLGRALKISDDVYLDVETSYTSYSLKAKEDWSYTFADLPKYGEVQIGSSTMKYPYVYYVTEVVPIGFHNSNSEAQYTEINTGKYFIASEIADDKYSFTLKNQEDRTYTLSVCKRVTGNFGNKTKDFDFDISFKDQDGRPLTGTGFTMQFTDLYDSSYVRNRTYTLETGRISISLPHGKKVQFLSLPEGTQYTITEKTADGYSVYSGEYSAESSDADIAQLSAGTLSEKGVRVQSGKLDADKAYLFINERKGTIPAGITLYAAAPAVMALLLLALMGFILRKKKARTEN